MRSDFNFLSAVLCISLACSMAHAGVFISAQFLGTPRESTAPNARTMPGWGSGVPYLFSDGGPILSVDFGGTAAGGEPYGIYGALGQRWQSSQSDGVYDITTPGPINVYNAQSSLSFDSHFINNDDRIFTIAPTEGNAIFPGLNPIPSTPEFGYGHGAFPGTLETTGYLRGKFEMLPFAQATELPLAYVTFGGSVSLFGRAVTTDGSFEFAVAILWQEVPEPTSGLTLVGLTIFGLKRRRN